MAPAFSDVYFFMVVMASMIGIPANLLIVTFYLQERAKGRRLNTCDIILVALGICSICFQCSTLGQSCAYGVCSVVSGILLQFKVWSSSCSSCFIACLSVFYCIKIVDFNNHLFFWLKLRISKLVRWMLLGSVLASLVLSIPSYWNFYIVFPQNSTNNLNVNSTLICEVMLSDRPYFYAAAAFGICLPALFGIASITVTLISLSRHIQRMKNNALGFSQPRLEVHFGAVKMVGSLLFICALILLSQFLMMLVHIYWFKLIIGIVSGFSAPVQSIVVILGITKLRKAFKKILNYWRKGRDLCRIHM